MPISRPLFVDASGWAALADATDAYHAASAAEMAIAIHQLRTIITTNYVLAEVVALISSRRVRISHAQMVAFINGIRTDPSIQIEHITSQLDEQAWQLIASRADKQWSQVDASSFILMRQLSITEALTTDAHFSQAGFVRLPQP